MSDPTACAEPKYSLSLSINNGTPELLVYQPESFVEPAICVPLNDERIEFMVNIREYIVTLNKAAIEHKKKAERA